ncbi:MAG: endolytic transglycosylase MltG [Chroococcales cyanobacterium]
MMSTPKSIPKWFYYLALLPLVMGVSAWQGWAWWSWATAPPVSSDNVVNESDGLVQIQIPPGTAGQQIGQDLEAAGLIRSAKAWRMWAFLKGMEDPEGAFKAGTYKLSPSDPLPAIADQIWKGEVMQLSFTIPEGWNLKQMAKYFESIGYFSAEEFLQATKEIPRDQYPWLPEDLPHLEGFLFPNTYTLASDRVSPQEVIAIMLEHFEKVALPIYEEGKNQTSLSLLEWVSLASIVEKEAVVGEERGQIAGVFAARLRRGMKLQADPTVEYALGIQQTADQPLTYAQVETPSPYNTYVNPGLPPTAIASPGLASLKATLYPENTEYLYFVARYDGTHVFSKTLAAHEAATRAIRQQRQLQQSN